MLNKIKRKAPLAYFIVSRIITMFVLLFLLGFALFGLMELAPGDIVDQMMAQQIMVAGQGETSANRAGADNAFSEEQLAKTRAEFGIDKPFYIQVSRAWAVDFMAN